MVAAAPPPIAREAFHNTHGTLFINFKKSPHERIHEGQ